MRLTQRPWCRRLTTLLAALAAGTLATTAAPPTAAQASLHGCAEPYVCGYRNGSFNTLHVRYSAAQLFADGNGINLPASTNDTISGVINMAGPGVTVRWCQKYDMGGYCFNLPPGAAWDLHGQWIEDRISSLDERL